MGRKLEKVKKIVEENKGKLIFGAALGVGFVGGVIFCGKMCPVSKEELDMIKNFREFGGGVREGGTLIGKLNEIQAASNHCDTFFNGLNPTIATIGPSTMTYYESMGVDLGTECVGLAVFLKK